MRGASVPSGADVGPPLHTWIHATKLILHVFLFCFQWSSNLFTFFFPEQFDMGDVLISGKPTGMCRRQN